MEKVLFETVKACDSTNIRAVRYEPETSPIGILQIIHGFGEGIGHYDDMVDFFTNKGYACVMHDQRGFGEMPDKTPRQRKRARGIVSNYKCLMCDIKTIRSQINEWYPEIPVILFGHSMGGNIVANYLIKFPQAEYEKAILEAPWLRLYKPFPEFARKFAKFAGKISEKLALKAKLKIDSISRNQDKTKNLLNDGIFHTRMSLKLFAEITDAGEHAIKNAGHIKIPALLLCPGKDEIVCPKAIREFAALTGENVKFIEYPDGYHSLHSDIICDEVLSEMLAFCKKDYS